MYYLINLDIFRNQYRKKGILAMPVIGLIWILISLIFSIGFLSWSPLIKQCFNCRFFFNLSCLMDLSSQCTVFNELYCQVFTQINWHSSQFLESTWFTYRTTISEIVWASRSLLAAFWYHSIANLFVFTTYSLFIYGKQIFFEAKYMISSRLWLYIP